MLQHGVRHIWLASSLETNSYPCLEEDLHNGGRASRAGIVRSHMLQAMSMALTLARLARRRVGGKSRLGHRCTSTRPARSPRGRVLPSSPAVFIQPKIASTPVRVH
jgi:hypothetical protein